MAKILKSNIPLKSPISENLIEFIKSGLRTHADRTLIVDSETGISWTGKEIEASVSSIAKSLREEHQLQKGDVCTLLGKESSQMALMILGIWAAGGICHFLNDNYHGSSIKNSAVAMKSKYFITSLRFMSEDKEYAEQLALSGIKLISLFELSASSQCFCKEKLDYSDNLDSLLREVSIDSSNDLALIQHTSGSTGEPKHVPRTHKNLCHLVAAVDHEDLMELKPGVVMSGSLPMTCSLGIWALLASINSGGTFVIHPELSFVQDIFAMIQQYKVTLFSAPTGLMTVFDNVDPELKAQFNLTSLDHIFSEGTNIFNPDLPKSLIESYGLKSFQQGFTMAEAGWVFLTEKSKSRENALSVGHVLPGVEAMVVDRESREMLSANESGEIVLEGPQIFPGYLTDTPGVFNRCNFSEAGRFMTGDRGYYDVDKLVYINGRYEEVMVFGDRTYFATELEAIVAEHPAVSDACVVKWSSDHHKFPEGSVRVSIIRKKGAEVSHWQIIDHMKEQAPSVLICGLVQDARFEPFPSMPNGKVRRRMMAK